MNGRRNEFIDFPTILGWGETMCALMPRSLTQKSISLTCNPEISLENRGEGTGGQMDGQMNGRMDGLMPYGAPILRGGGGGLAYSCSAGQHF